MKKSLKWFLLVIIIIIIILIIVVSFFKETEEKEIEELPDFYSEIQEMSDEEALNMLELTGDIGDEMVRKEFDAQRSLDLPNSFPEELIYESGKVIGLTDASVEGRINLNVAFRALSDFETIQSFFQNVISDDLDLEIYESKKEENYYILTAGDRETVGQNEKIIVTIYYNEERLWIDFYVDYSLASTVYSE